MEARVEVDELGDERADPAGGAQLVRLFRRHDRLVGDVEPDHRHVEPAREHAPGGLGVGPDVELGGRRAVALADRAAHQDDPLGPRVGMEREQERRRS